ncbi:MAG: hypothetical protein LBK99_04665 [Opitutaceae bacterium]|jgi:hypothetical protein|nr:hypothetical protein [Opitutaceae bacterium]
MKKSFTPHLYIQSRRQLVLPVAFLASLTGAVTCANAATLLNEGFESFTNGTVITATPANGWYNTDNASTPAGGVAKISSDQKHTGDNSLYLMDTAETYTATANYNFGETVSAGTLDFWILSAPDYTSAGRINYRVEFLRPGGGSNFALIIGAGTSTFSFRNSSSTGNNLKTVTFSETGNAYIASGWNHFVISFDDAAKSVSILLNDVTVMSLSSADFASITLTTGYATPTLMVSGIGFNVGWGAGVAHVAYVDDILFTTPASAVPELSAWGILAGLLSIVPVLVFRRRR